MPHDQKISPTITSQHHPAPWPSLLFWMVFLFFCLSPIRVQAGEISLTWDPPATEYGGFILAYGTTSGSYNYSQNVGQQTRYTVSSLNADQVYYFAVKAYSTTGKEESSYSNEVSAMIPVPAPQADFYATPISGFAPLPVAFTDASSGRTDGWSWKFGDGATSTERHPTHKYAIPGIYTVTLTVSGEGGSNTKTTNGFVSVRAEEGLKAHFTATPVNGTGPLMVTFTDTSTGQITGWLWDFGDGTTSTSQHPSHKYMEGGNYSVALTVIGQGITNTFSEKNFVKVRSSGNSSQKGGQKK